MLNRPDMPIKNQYIPTGSAPDFEDLPATNVGLAPQPDARCQKDMCLWCDPSLRDGWGVEATVFSPAG